MLLMVSLRPFKEKFNTHSGHVIWEKLREKDVKEYA